MIILKQTNKPLRRQAIGHQPFRRAENILTMESLILAQDER